MDRIELDKAFIELLAPNIILVTTKENAILEVEDVDEIKKVNVELTKGFKYGVISLAGNFSSVSEKTRKHLASKGIEKNRIATAFIINSLSHRLLLRFFIKINKPSVPTKAFLTLKDARKWMEKQINQL